jgi:hypothetical protein
MQHAAVPTELGAASFALAFPPAPPLPAVLDSPPVPAAVAFRADFSVDSSFSASLLFALSVVAVSFFGFFSFAVSFFSSLGVGFGVGFFRGSELAWALAWESVSVSCSGSVWELDSVSPKWSAKEFRFRSSLLAAPRAWAVRWSVPASPLPV